jgi:hypothetical protein
MLSIVLTWVQLTVFTRNDLLHCHMYDCPWLCYLGNGIDCCWVGIWKANKNETSPTSKTTYFRDYSTYKITHDYLQGPKLFLRSLQLRSYSRICLKFMESEGSLECLYEPSISPILIQINPIHTTQSSISKAYFNKIIPLTTMFFQLFRSSLVSHQNPK